MSCLQQRWSKIERRKGEREGEEEKEKGGEEKEKGRGLGTRERVREEGERKRNSHWTLILQIAHQSKHIINQLYMIINIM